MNILLIGHACGPGLGSEPGNTWNWAQALSEKHRVWLITHPQHREAAEDYLALHPNHHLQFIWVNLNRRLDPWKPERGERGIRIHYLLWLSEAYRRANELCRTTQIDLAHHLSLATIGAPPPLSRLPVPTLWGPIGGGQTTDPRYLHFFGRQQWIERIRTARVKALTRSRSLRRNTQACQRIFATNRETADLLNGVGVACVEMLLDCGLPVSSVPGRVPESLSDPERFTLVSAGRLEYRKGLALALHALARVRNTRVHLQIAGRGPQQEELMSLAYKLRLAGRVSFLGFVPHDEMPALFRKASAFLFPSLRDSSGSVVLEAMAQGLPVITLNHQGIGTFLPEEAAVKVTVSDPEPTIDGLAAAIDDLAASPARLATMRVASWNFARNQTWDKRAAHMNTVYENLANLKRESVLVAERS